MTSMTMDQLLAKFEKIHLPSISVNSAMRYKIDIDYRIRPNLGELEVQSITRLDIEAFRAAIIKQISPKSVNSCMAVLSVVFGKAVEWGLLEKSPMAIKKLKVQSPAYQWWSKDHIQKFLVEAQRNKYYAAFLLALECGLRMGEIIGLSKNDVDLERCQLHIRRQWLESQHCMGPTKARKARFINFSPNSDLKSALAEAIDKSPHPEAIFVSKTGQRINPSKLRSKVMPILIKRAGVPRIRFHDLRHSYASHFMLEHDDIWSLMKILGHGDIAVTQRYAHLSPRSSTLSLNWSASARG